MGKGQGRGGGSVAAAAAASADAMEGGVAAMTETADDEPDDNSSRNNNNNHVNGDLNHTSAAGGGSDNNNSNNNNNMNLGNSSNSNGPSGGGGDHPLTLALTGELAVSSSSSSSSSFFNGSEDGLLPLPSITASATTHSTSHRFNMPEPAAPAHFSSLPPLAGSMPLATDSQLQFSHQSNQLSDFYAYDDADLKLPPRGSEFHYPDEADQHSNVLPVDAVVPISIPVEDYGFPIDDSPIDFLAASDDHAAPSIASSAPSSPSSLRSTSSSFNDSPHSSSPLTAAFSITKSSSSKPKKPKKSRRGSHRLHTPDGSHVPSHPDQPNVHATPQKRQRKMTLAPHGLLDRLLFLWGWELISRVEQAEDILVDLRLHLRSSESAKTTGERMTAFWDAECARAAPPNKDGGTGARPAPDASKQKTRRSRLWKALKSALTPSFARLTAWKIGWAICAWMASYALIKWLLIYCEDRVEDSDQGIAPPPSWRGHVIALGMFLSCIGASICFHQLAISSTRLGIQCRAGLMVLIYRKALRLSYVKGGVSDIVNLISTECNRIAEAAVNWHFLWSALADILVVIILAFVDIGLAAFPSMGLFLLLLLPLQIWVSVAIARSSLKATSQFTKRVHLMSEALTAIRLIKMYAWEAWHVGRVQDARKDEVKAAKKAARLRALGIAVVGSAPVAAMLVALCVAIWGIREGLSASSVFALLSLFNMVRYPLLTLPNAIRNIKSASVSIEKLEEFFDLPEVDTILDPPVEDDPSLIMEIKNADFVWDGDLDHPHIYDLNLDIRRGQVIAIVGDLSSGKSLLAAVMGQIKRTAGTIRRAPYAKFGYVPQEPWLINATLRDNILFGLDMDSKRYADVVRLCGLTRDLMLLSNGDDTVVGDLSLSVGQRHKISLARCIYHDPEVLLLEECLADFDQTTARRVFKECLKSDLLHTKAVLLVTQQKQFLPDCDLILVLKNGRVIERGTFAELKSRKVNFSAWVSDYVPIEDDPSGVLEKVNEIRLDSPPLPSVRGPSVLSYISTRLSGGSVAVRAPFGGPRRSTKLHIPSPLGTAAVITNELTASELQLKEIVSGPSNPEAANELTIRALITMNNASIQNAELNEQTISKIIEKSQESVLSTPGVTTSVRPPANFANQDPVTKTIEYNQLTIHSLLQQEAAEVLVDKGIIARSATLGGNLSSYVTYLSDGSGLIFAVAVMSLFLLSQGVRAVSDYWLVFILDNGDKGSPYSNTFAVGIYTLFFGIFVVAILVRGLLYSLFVLKNSESVQARTLRAVMRAPMSYYDTTPVGQILASFARDLFLVDDLLPETALQVLSVGPMVVSVLLMALAFVSWLWTTLPLYLVAGSYVIYRCVAAEKPLRNLEASNKSPMFVHLSATLEGLFSIRLYEAQDRFEGFNRSLIDADHKALFAIQVVKTVQALYLDLICSLAVYMTCLLVVAQPRLSPSAAGLAVSNILQLMFFIPFLARLAGDLHVCIRGVGSVYRFIESVPSEPVSLKPPKQTISWPSEGVVEFKQVTLRYHRYGVAVLKSVTFKLKPGEKVGIVGRSGSGKTSLLVALLRLAENTDGDILIDGINTNTLDLGALRGRVAVIPAEPVLLMGTIRSNLDPYNYRTDEEIWQALRNVHLGAKMEEMPLGLETSIAENGRTFSLAERQLFCIARAILLRTKVVVFDEPKTAADNDTDALIQSTIKDNFKDATVIVLASRFRMIAEADRIMVMEGGKIVEFETPLTLLDNPKSKFSLMISQTGNIDPERLRQMAIAKEERSASTKRLWKGGVMKVDLLAPAMAGGSVSGVRKGKSSEGLGEGYLKSSGSASSGTGSSQFLQKQLLKRSLGVDETSVDPDLDSWGKVAAKGSKPSNPMPKSLEEIFAPPPSQS